jgi:hypothetical protein
VGLAHNSSIVTNGLVLCLDAANRKSYPGSGTTWTDLSGKGNNVAFGNGTIFSNLNGGLVSFDGTNDYASAAANSDFAYGTGDYAIEILMYATTLAQTGSYPGAEHVIYAQTVGGTNYLVMVFNGSGIISFVYAASGGGTAVSSPTNTIKAQVYHHVVVSRIGSNLRLYVDNNIAAEQTNTFNFSNTTYPPTIGNYSHSYGEIPFAGRIPIVRIYKGKGLTQAEIQQNFNATRGRYGI